MTFTPQQNDFFALCDEQPTQSVFLRAVAGSGKTTTVVEFARRTPKAQKTLFLAFNKEIAETLKARLPYWVEASTFHSFCFDALGRHLGAKPRVDARRTAHLLKEILPAFKDRRDIEEDVVTLVSRAKAVGYGANCDTPLSEIAEYFNVNTDNNVLPLADEILERSAAAKGPLDFDDMIWLPLLWNVAWPPVHTVVIDESQDTNGVQREVLRRLKPQRVIAVGDPAQAIYGFRGADANACDALCAAFGMTEMPLSVSWRCSQRVVAEAQKYL